ncbi:MAG TPA: DNA alkylation repair protein [Planctomycetaceae bacterium]|nr:DNA alkylation repair protein [Planctomycetaceae bacterium]
MPAAAPAAPRAAARAAAEIIDELKALGSDSIKRVLIKHGAREPFFGVKIEHLKKIQKRLKTSHELALELYASGISDAMYLAGLIADDARMTRRDLNRWVKQAYWYMLSEYTVPWVAAGSPHGRELALEWIESKQESTAAAGWMTLASLVSITPDVELDLPELRRLLERVRKTIHQQPNRVRHTMNCFVIALGASVKPLTALAIKAAEQIGRVSVDMGETACKVPFAPDYIRMIEARGAIGKKRKSAKC